MGIWGALKAILQLLSFLKDAILLWNKAKKEKWAAEGAIAIKAIKEAKTDAERKALARKLARVGMFPDA